MDCDSPRARNKGVRGIQERLIWAKLMADARYSFEREFIDIHVLTAVGLVQQATFDATKVSFEGIFSDDPLYVSYSATTSPQCGT
jgi:hypothetical protein